MRVIKFEEKYRDDMIYMILSSKDVMAVPFSQAEYFD
jgi:hypothetical protein